MKKLVLAVISLLIGWGCTESSNEELSTQTSENVIVRFNVELMSEILPFPATKSIPSTDIPEPGSEDNSEIEVPSNKELSDFCNTIEYILFKQEGEKLSFYKRKTFTLQDEDFSIVYDTLSRGQYHICFVAHNSKDVSLEDQVLKFGEVNDTFYKQIDINIKTSDEVNQSIELERIVSRIEFMARDLVPEKAEHFDMKVKNWSNGFDLLTGNGILNSEEKSFTHVFMPNEIGKENMIHSFYTFVPVDEIKLETQLSAWAKDENLLRDRLVTGITPYRNKIIRYKGLLYSLSDSEETFQLEIFNNGKWEEVEEELPDR